MSYRDRDRRDDRRRDYAHENPSSTRRGADTGREREREYPKDRSERRRSRSSSPRRRDDRDRRDGKGRPDRRRSRSPHSPRDRQRSKERDYDSRRRDDRYNDRKSDRRDDRKERGHETGGRETHDRDDRRDENGTRNDNSESKMQVDSKAPLYPSEANEEDMMAMMGFSGFGTTKGHAVEGNQEGAVKINQQRTWRQYMNRRGGFNRPLDRVK